MANKRNKHNQKAETKAERRRNKSACKHYTKEEFSELFYEESTGSFIEKSNDPLYNLPPVKCKNGRQKELCNSIKDKDITLSIGSSGTGKTYGALLQALNLVKHNEQFEKVVLVKSVTTIKGEDIGFIPGSVEEKMAPFIYSYSGNVDKILGKKGAFDELVKAGIIEIQPMAYIRGISIDKAVVIVDEFQNFTSDMFKSIVTRIGEDSHYVFLGDEEQTDRHRKQESCTNKILKAFENNELVGVIKFNDEDCIRNPIIPKILQTLRENNI